MMKRLIIAFFLLGAITKVRAQTPRITFKSPLLYPEGVAFDKANKTFYLSSVKTGAIGTVDQFGNYKEFYKDKDLISSFGMKIDAKAKRLLICLSDPNPNYSEFSSAETLKKMGRLIAVSLVTKKKTMDVNLAELYPGHHFINDLTMDNSGNLYITDSYSPVIYKIDVQGKASVFSESELFKSGDIGLNGIAYHTAGYLITVNNSNGSILKVDLADPKKISKVAIKNLFPGADGLLFDQGELILVQNKGVNKIFRIASADDWQTASVKAATSGEDRFAQPSTAIADANRIWVLNSKLNELSNPAMVPSKEFSLQLAVFRPVN